MREYVLIQNLLLPGLRPLLVALAAALTGSLAFVSVAWALPFVVVLVAAWWLLPLNQGRLSIHILLVTG